MEFIIIRKAILQDAAALQEIGRQTFYDTFEATNTPENMEKYLEENFSIEKLTEELANPSSQFYYALLNGQMVGYLKLNLNGSQTELQDDEALEIERIYVLKNFQGMKIGQVLYEKAIEVAQQYKVPYIWLGVWEKNDRALNFYKKNGFVAFDQHIFRLGDDEQTDIMMKKMLHTNVS